MEMLWKMCINITNHALSEKNDLLFFQYLFLTCWLTNDEMADTLNAIC